TQVAVRTTSPRELVDAWCTTPPTELIGVALSSSALPENQGVVLRGYLGGTQLRVIVRVSGTEAKAKIYIEIAQATSHAEATQLLEKLQDEVEGWGRSL
ncbi:MAG: phospho-sugar mutase, partial [Corynebacterium sp.]|nr:phospho-sugar mutase [Corynebacterium sp.]